MPIQFTCPHCGEAVSVDDKYAGHTGPCRRCGKPITIPGAALPPARSAAENAAPARRSSKPWGVILGGCFVVFLFAMGVLAALLWPAVSKAREASLRLNCKNNHKQIALALLKYESATSRFPPAHSLDSNGKPQHSWRVLILPYLDEQALYEEFNLDEPWDSPHNLDVAKEMPEYFRCPFRTDAGETTTSYMVVCDANSAFPSGKGMRRQDIRDGTTKTVAIVEVSDYKVHWTEPKDLSMRELAKISSFHTAPNVAYLDASVATVDQVTPNMVLRNDGS